MGRRKDAMARCVVRRIEAQSHQLVKRLAHNHVAVQQHHPVKLDQAECDQLCPGIVESRIVGITLATQRGQMGDSPCCDSARIQGGESRGRQRIGIEGDKGVLTADFLDRVAESEDSREIVEICDQAGPDC